LTTDAFRYAICNETFGDWPLDRALSFAKDIGYSGWEVAPFMLSDDARKLTARERTDYRKTVEAAGLEIVGLHWLLAKTSGFHITTMDSAVRAATSSYINELVRLCSDLGGKVMVLGSPQQRNVAKDQSMESAMQNAAEVLRSVVPALEEFDIRIAIEPLGPEEGNFLNTATEGRHLIERVGSPQVQMHLDVKAMSCEAKPVTEIIREFADLMIHFHANDPNRQGPGMGSVDFAPIMKTLADVRYDGWVSVEVFDYTPGVEKLVRESLVNLRAASIA
jgi:sugar phosphate isomerase/epimerase